MCPPDVSNYSQDSLTSRHSPVSQPAQKIVQNHQSPLSTLASSSRSLRCNLSLSRQHLLAEGRSLPPHPVQGRPHDQYPDHCHVHHRPKRDGGHSPHQRRILMTRRTLERVRSGERRRRRRKSVGRMGKRAREERRKGRTRTRRRPCLNWMQGENHTM